MHTVDINVSLAIHADSDADAVLIAHHLSRYLASLTYPHAAEVIDAPHITVTEPTVPYTAYDSEASGGPDIADATPQDADCEDERAAQIAIWESYGG